MALAIDSIEQIRYARKAWKEWTPEPKFTAGSINYVERPNFLPEGIAAAELDKPDSDDVIGLWGVDMAAHDEYAYQRPGCQNLVLEAMRRDIGVYLPPESDLMRPMPVYGISEWDHNYIKLTSRAKELSAGTQMAQAQIEEAKIKMVGMQGESHALNYFVSTWTSPYGMLPGMIIRQEPRTGMGSGITQFDGRPITRMNLAPAPPAPVLQAMTVDPEAQLWREAVAILAIHCGERGTSEGAIETLKRIIAERASAVDAALRATDALKHKGKKHRR